MRTLIAVVALALAAAPAYAQRKPCEELKEEIAVKVRKNGVKEFTLTIVPNAEVKGAQNVVGSCDGGTRKIIYQGGVPAPSK